MSKRISLVLALILAAACGSSPPAETCGAGTLNLNGTCVAPDGGPAVVCGAGTLLVAGQCVAADAGPGVTCGPGTVEDGGECVAADAGPGTVCGPGTELDGGDCVAVDAGPGTTCGPGTELDGGYCEPVDAGPGVVCGPGTELDGGACEPVDAGPGVTCGPGTVQDGGECVGVVCPSDCIAGHLRSTPCINDYTCNCAAPYYGQSCELEASTLLPATPVSGLFSGSSTYVYFGFDAPDGGTVAVSSPGGAVNLAVYTADGYLPFYPDTGQPQWAAAGYPSTQYVEQVGPSIDAGVPFYVMVLLTSNANFDYQITFTPY